MTPRQRQLLDELRKRQLRDEAALTPAERIRMASELTESWTRLSDYPVGMDEPPELVLAQLRRWRKLGKGT